MGQPIHDGAYRIRTASVSGDLAAAAANEVKTGLRSLDREGDKLKKFEDATKASVHALLLTKLVQSPSLQVIVTSADGCVLSTTVNVAVPAASVVTRPAVGVTVIPAASLSVLLTVTSAAFRPL
jgi:hypothetical protein